MTQVLIVKAVGDAGYAEPQTNAYISSKLDSPAPDNGFVRALIDQGKVDLVEELGENSDWEDFQAEVDRTPNNVPTEAVDGYKKSLKGGKKPAKEKSAVPDPAKNDPNLPPVPEAENT